MKNISELSVSVFLFNCQHGCATSVFLFNCKHGCAMFLGVILGEGLKQGCCSCPGPWAHVSGRGTLLGAFTTQWFALFHHERGKGEGDWQTNCCKYVLLQRLLAHGSEGLFLDSTRFSFLVHEHSEKKKATRRMCVREKENNNAE